MWEFQLLDYKLRNSFLNVYQILFECLQDGKTCKSKDKSPAYAIYSSRNELRLINIRNYLMRPLLSNLKNTVALDFYYTREQTFIFWTDVVDDKIYRGRLMEDTTTIIEIEAIIENGLGTAEGSYKSPLNLN